MFGKYQHRQAPLDERWAERKLFFWTARQSLLLVLLAAATVYVIVSLATGADPIPVQVMLPK